MTQEEALYAAWECLRAMASLGNDEAAIAAPVIGDLAGVYTKQRVRRQQRRQLRNGTAGLQGLRFHNGISGGRKP